LLAAPVTKYMPSLFLTAAWKKLLLANYPVDAGDLRPLVPARTELDRWEGSTYVSLVGFQFRDVRVRGWRIPYHDHFPEVNLRFYVRCKEEGKWKRGVVFVREIVPLRAVSFVANSLFRERYMTLPMRCEEQVSGGQVEVGYGWKFRGRWNELSARAASAPVPLAEGSKEEFITEHFWGYSGNGSRTGEYEVAHPRWEIYNVDRYTVDCDFGGLYGAAFEGLGSRKPASVFLAEGSPVQVYSKKIV
jgi:uncharacterized protein YqjF (DUF2071 family)